MSLIGTTPVSDDLRVLEEMHYRQVRVGGRSISLVPPSIRDPRLHLSSVILTIVAIGIAWLNFQLSISQFLVTFVVCGAIEAGIVLRRSAMLIWPASALQTATSTALLLRVVGTRNGDYWSLHGWYIFVTVGVLALVTKYRVRFATAHVFNPSNVALVVAFLILGSERVEPLDFWWAPLGPAMIAAYAVIFTGGVLICRRLGLIGMGLSFWVTLAAGMGVLAALGHSMTVRWSFAPISGAHFWWIILTSPETFIFLYFMITDPRTVPSGRVARIVFGVLVGVVASLLMAPWKSEFGTKVGLLSSLTVMCALRPLVSRWTPAPGSVDDDPRRWMAKLLTGGPDRAGTGLGGRGLAGRGLVGVLAVGAFGGAVVAANLPSRISTPVAIAAVDPAPAMGDLVHAVDPAYTPVPTIDPDVAGLSARLATAEGANDLVTQFVRDLDIENQAILTGDASFLPAVDHGERLEDMQAMVAAIAPGATRVVQAYEFDTLHLEVVFPGGLQTGANAGLVGSGRVIDVTYTHDGVEVDRVERPFVGTFALRQVTGDRWFVTDLLPPD